MTNKKPYSKPAYKAKPIHVAQNHCAHYKHYKNPKHPNHPSLYQNPLTLLKSYRDVRLSLHLSMEQHQNDFEQEYGMTITEYLDDIYAAGVEFTGTKLEHHANTMKRTAEMLKLVDKSIQLIKEHDSFGGEHECKCGNKCRGVNKCASINKGKADCSNKTNNDGESYYWILYYTFLSPKQLNSIEGIIQAVQTRCPYITKDNYFDRRKRALSMFASILWGFARCSSDGIKDDGKNDDARNDG